MNVQTNKIDALRACPTCGAVGQTEAAMVAESPAEKLGAEDLALRWRGFLAESCFFTYSRCTQCGQVYSQQYFADEELGQLYGSMGDNIHSGDAVLAALNQADYADMILQGAGSAKRYLEIGPDKGLLTRAVNARSPLEKGYLLEPNRSVWDELKASLPEGVAVLAPDTSAIDSDTSDASLDLVVAIHVLDHLTKPGDTLEWVNRKLKPGGTAAMLVHNEASLLARTFGRRFPIYCLQHPQLYNPKTLARAMERAGFHVSWVKRTPNTFRLGYLLEHGLRASLGLDLHLSGLAWPIKLRLGNIMALAIKK